MEEQRPLNPRVRSSILRSSAINAVPPSLIEMYRAGVVANVWRLGPKGPVYVPVSELVDVGAPWCYSSKVEHPVVNRQTGDRYPVASPIPVPGGGRTVPVRCGDYGPTLPGR